jgi:hypothetical protein
LQHRRRHHAALAAAFRVGDYIETGSVAGTAEESTTLYAPQDLGRHLQVRAQFALWNTTPPTIPATAAAGADQFIAYEDDIARRAGAGRYVAASRCARRSAGAGAAVAGRQRRGAAAARLVDHSRFWDTRWDLTEAAKAWRRPASPSPSQQVVHWASDSAPPPVQQPVQPPPPPSGSAVA